VVRDRGHGLKRHRYSASHGTTVRLEQDLLAKNNRLAERNRRWLAARKIMAINLISAPGAGKTTLLERTIRDLSSELRMQVIEGDQATDHDAERIRATGCPAFQVNTGAGCHLDAEMVARGMRHLNPPAHSILMIENVGNLVCPALFDLGEFAKVVVCSVTEGEDKPLKYPHIFRASNVMILNKTDLLPYIEFDVHRCLDYARRVNPRLHVVQVSAARGDRLGRWYDWLRAQQASFMPTPGMTLELHLVHQTPKVTAPTHAVPPSVRACGWQDFVRD
jgi:hydrogenase nickel incorporation protein HypB